jgi:ABC-type multidrug transport system fused ATPase/permease subunit
MSSWFSGYKGLYAEVLDAVQGMATLKAFNASGRKGEELAAQSRAFARDSVRLNAIVIIYVAVVALVVGVGTAFAIGLGAIRLANGQLSVVELLTILMLAGECFRPLQSLEKAYHANYRSGPAGAAIFDLLDAEPDIAGGGAELRARPGGEPPALTFEQVTLRYRADDPPALDGFTLDVSAGERVALVGRSGAGKTTVVSLLLRFFDPDSGRISVGGQDISELPLDRLRSLVAVVSQDTYLFHGTIRQNLELARPDATTEQLIAATEAAQAHKFITELPDGYDTMVGERGLKLSGGQRQRVAIARALLKDAPILVLDEATSSVDAASEAGIQQAFDVLTGGRTTLMIAHRLSTVRNADRLVVLDRGRITEIGDHTTLLAERGAYASLVAAQGGQG